MQQCEIIHLYTNGGCGMTFLLELESKATKALWSLEHEKYGEAAAWLEDILESIEQYKYEMSEE